jgi:hypothetical protein
VRLVTQPPFYLCKFGLNYILSSNRCALVHDSRLLHREKYWLYVVETANFMKCISVYIKNTATELFRSRDSSVGIAMGYGLDGPDSIPGMERFFSSPQCPDRIWGPPSLLSSRHRALFPRDKVVGT